MPLKRSVINQSIATAKTVFAHFGISLPPLAFWTCEDWRAAGPELDEVRDCRIGWDVTDFGSGRFNHIGRTLFTLRNGRHDDPRYPKGYAEKLILDPEGQRAPLHFHRSKREDIINRAGGNILITLMATDADDRPSRSPLSVVVDGCCTQIDAGSVIRLTPGMSVCIPPRTFHQFWGEEGTGWRINDTGYTVSGEVSTVCDDTSDNVFLEGMTRFPPIEEDQPLQTFLCHEYPAPPQDGYSTTRRDSHLPKKVSTCIILTAQVPLLA